MVAIKITDTPNTTKLRWKSKLVTEEIKENIDNPIPLWQSQVDDWLTQITRAIRDTIEYYEDYVFPQKAEIIKQKYLNGTDRAIVMKEMWLGQRTNRVFPLIWPVHDTFLSNLHEIETTPRVIARNKDDQAKAPVAQDWYDWAKDVSEYESQMKIVRSEATLIWTSYARSWYSTDIHVVEWNDKGKRKESKREEVKPVIDHISFFQLFYDPFQPNFYKLPWKAYRYITNLNNAINKYSFLFSDEDPIDKWIPTINAWAPLSNKDYTRIYSAKNYEKELIEWWTNWYDNWINNKLFQVQYQDQNLVEVIEYWQDGQLNLIINWVSIYEWLSPYPFNSDPFLIVVHEEVPNCIHWVGIWDKLINHQHQANTIFSWLEDIMRMNLYPMYKMSKWALKDAAGKSLRSIPYEPERVLESSANLWTWDIEPIKYVDFNFVSTFMKRLNDIVMESYEIVWLNSYTQWWNGKMERSAQWVTQKVAIIKTRLLSIIESLNRFNSKLFVMWLAMWVVKFPKNFNFRVVREDWEAQWNDIKLDDVLNKFDIVAESEAMRIATKELKATQSLNTLNVLSSVNVNPVTWFPIYKMDPLMEAVMEKHDFPAWVRYTEAELAELKAMQMRVESAWQPQAPVSPQTPVQEPVLNPQSLNSDVPDDAWMLASVYRQASQGM